MALMETAQANQARLTRQGSYTNGGGQWITHELFDTLPFPATNVPMDFFANPISGTKSAALTNMKQAGQLPVNQNFRFYAVEIAVIVTAASAAANFTAMASLFRTIQRSLFQFVIDGREYDLQFSGAALLPAVIATSISTSGTVEAGRLTAKGEYRLSSKINIGSLTSFGLKVTFDPSAQMTADLLLLSVAATGASLQTRLSGELLRTIQ